MHRWIFQKKNIFWQGSQQQISFIAKEIFDNFFLKIHIFWKFPVKNAKIWKFWKLDKPLIFVGKFASFHNTQFLPTCCIKYSPVEFLCKIILIPKFINRVVKCLFCTFLMNNLKYLSITRCSQVAKAELWCHLHCNAWAVKVLSNPLYFNPRYYNRSDSMCPPRVW